MVHSYHGILFRNKINEILMISKTWVNLKNIIQSERSQSQNTKCSMNPFLCNF